jgi:hypothetical protein
LIALQVRKKRAQKNVRTAGRQEASRKDKDRTWSSCACRAQAGGAWQWACQFFGRAPYKQQAVKKLLYHMPNQNQNRAVE